MAKSILGGYLYLVFAQPDKPGCWIVSKLEAGKKASANPDEYLVDENGVCSCRAAEFGNSCKHVQMVNKTLEGAEFNRTLAENILDDYLEVVRETIPGAAITSLLRFGKSKKVTKATALGGGMLNGEATDRLDIWGERKGLLVLVQIFRDRDKYRKTLKTIRYKSEGNSVPQADSRGYVPGVGQTYGR